MAASGDSDHVARILADYRTAPIDARLRAALEFLEKLVIAPDAMTPDDARRAIGAGVSKQALSEAAYVAFVFGVMDRLADAFGFEPETGKELVWTARILLRLGYGVGSVPG